MIKDNDSVNHPKHYLSHPSGIETIQITRHMNFNLGNAIKYLMRCDHKGKAIEDLKKAQWYIQDEIGRRMDEEAVQNWKSVKEDCLNVLPRLSQSPKVQATGTAATNMRSTD